VRKSPGGREGRSESDFRMEVEGENDFGHLWKNPQTDPSGEEG
jgi:hypothetical protein